MNNLPQDHVASGNRDLPESGTLLFENPEQAKGYTTISNFVLFDPTISPGAKTTYALLLSFAWQEARSFPGQQRLAKILGVSDRHVRRYLTELTAKQYIQVKRRGLGKTNLHLISDLSRLARMTSAEEKRTQVLPSRKLEADRTPVSYPERTFMSDPDRTQMSSKQDSGEEDSDPSKYRKVEKHGMKSKGIYSEAIAKAIDGLSKTELNDPFHVHANITQAQNLWHDSKSSSEDFIRLIQEARERTMQHSDRIRRIADGGRGTKNRAPYFFKVLKTLTREAKFGEQKHALLSAMSIPRTRS